MSTQESDLGILPLEGLDQEQIETLDHWISLFDSKYPHIGHLVD